MPITQFEIDDAAYRFVVSARDHFRLQRQNAFYEKKWKEYERSYENDTDDFYKGVARVRIPALNQAIERSIPKVEKMTFPISGKWFGASPDNPEDEIQLADAELSVIFLRDQVKTINARSKIIQAYRSEAIYGTVFIKTFWAHELKERFIRDLKNKRVKVWDVLIDNPDFYIPSIWDIYADIKDEDLKGLVIEKIIKDYQELWNNRERIENGKKVGVFRNVEFLKAGINPDTRTEKSDQQQSLAIRGLKDSGFGSHEAKVEIYEAWGMIPKWFLTRSEEDKENRLFVNGFIVIAEKAEGNGKVLLISDNPFDHQDIPYLRSRYIPIQGKLYGHGVMTVNIPLEAELNTLRNQAMDNRTFMLKRKWLKDINAEIDDNALRDLAEQVIETNNMVGLREINVQDFTPSIVGLDQLIKQDIEDSTGATKLLAGTPTGGSLDRTASGIATVTQGALDRLELVVTTFEEEFLKPLLKKLWQLNQQFLPEGREVSVLGQGMVRVFPRDIALPDINFHGIKELAEKEFKITQLNLLFQNLATLSQFGLDPVPIVLRQMELMGEHKLIPEIDKRPDKIQELEETPEGEIQLLRFGQRIKINFDDDHVPFIQAYQTLLAEKDLPERVRKNTEDALLQRQVAQQLRNNPEIAANILRSRKQIGIPEIRNIES